MSLNDGLVAAYNFDGDLTDAHAGLGWTGTVTYDTGKIGQALAVPTLLGNLYSWHRFDGDLTDASGQDHALTFTVQSVGYTTGLPGHGQGMRPHQTVDLRHAEGPTNVRTISIAGWILGAELDDGHFVLMYDTVTDAVYQFHGQEDVTNKLYFRTRTWGPIELDDLAVPGPRHLAASTTYDGAGSVTVKCYLDGVLKISRTDPAWDDATEFFEANPLRFGINPANAINEGSPLAVYDLWGAWTRALADGGVSVGQAAGGDIARLYAAGAGLDYPFGWSQTPYRTAPFVASGSFSVEAWVYFEADAVGGLVWGQVPAAGAVSVPRQGVRVLNPSSANVAVSVNGFTNGVYAAGDLRGRWTHLILAYDHANTRAKLYVDGYLRLSVVATADYSGTLWANAAGLYNAATNVPAAGLRVDLNRVWSRALTDGGVALDQAAGGEVAELWNAGAGLAYPFATPPVPPVSTRLVIAVDAKINIVIARRPN